MLVPEEFEVFASTDVGRKRKHNEDSFLVDPELRLFVVADGMGGHAAGEVASAMAVEGIREAVAANRAVLAARAEQGAESGVSVKHVLSLLEAAVQRASARIHNEARIDRHKRGMGTTVSLILFIGSHGYVAHVGDSRIYLVRNGTAHQVTEDHTIANELVKLGMVTPDQLSKIPRKNAITRAVGVYEHVEVDTLTLEVLPNDRFVLASDGLCGYLDDEGTQLTKLLQESDGQSCVQGMIDYANARGGKDNVTAVLVKLGGDAAAAGDMAERLRMKREVLATMPLFRKLTERELLRILHAALLLRLDAGEDAVLEGESGDRMFVVLSGEFQVLKGQAVLRSLGPGEHFGEMALLRSTTRSATVRAAEPGELVVLRRSDFFEIIRTEPHIAVKLLWQFLGVLSERLDQTSNDLRHAREELEGEYLEALPFPLEQSVEIDPFAAQSNLNTLPLSLDAESPEPPGIEEPHTFPGFDDAPEMAIRREPEERIKDSPTFDDAPAMARRLTPAGQGIPGEIPVVETSSSAAPTQRKRDPAERSNSEPAATPSRPLPKVTVEMRTPERTLASPAVSDDVDDLAKTRVRHTIQMAEENERPHTVPPITQPSVEDGIAGIANTQPNVIEEYEDTNKTIPLVRRPKLDRELRELREQFKERLKSSRAQREPKDSD